MANCESRIGKEIILNTENVIVTCTDVSIALGPLAWRYTNRVEPVAMKGSVR